MRAARNAGGLIVLAVHVAALGLAVSAPPTALPPGRIDAALWISASSKSAPDMLVSTTALAVANAATDTPATATDPAPVVAGGGDQTPAGAAPVPDTPEPNTPAPAGPATPARLPPGFADPLEGFNRLSYAISQPFDRFLLRPIAIAYKTVVPKPLRDGVRNVFANLRAPVVLINDILQLRPKRAAKTIARFFINSFFGIAGLFDVAKRPVFNVQGHPNGFGDTLGYYRIGPGFYIYLPILGPTTVRDAAGTAVDLLSEPHLATRLITPARRRRPQVTANKLFFGQIALDLNTGTEALDGIGLRAENDAALQAIKHGSVDPYATLRSAFLQSRAGEIAALRARDGHPAPTIELDDPLKDPAAR